MKISYSFNDNILLMQAKPDPDDIEFYSSKKAIMARDTAEFDLSGGINISLTHPDILALLAIIVFGPFARLNLEFSWGVSQEFAETVKSHFRRNVTPVDVDIFPRKISEGARPSLAFSGGVDSFAALAILPDDTVPIFCNRTWPEGAPKGMYKADAALLACKELEASHDVRVVNTDMEFVRSPVGFAVDWTNAAGAVLLADTLNLNSVSFGMIMESAYFIGHPYYSDLRGRSVYKAWAPLFEIVNLPISLPTSGVSEVLTSKIVAHKEGVWHPESCVRGIVGKPCMACFKCFRKTILDHRLKDTDLSKVHFLTALTSREVKRRLLESPVHHENVLAFSVFGLKCEENEILDAIKKKTFGVYTYGQGLGFLERFYPKSMDLVPNFLVDSVVEKIQLYADPYSAQDVAIVENWDTASLTDKALSKAGHKMLEEILK